MNENFKKGNNRRSLEEGIMQTVWKPFKGIY
jgi:hypothetical protein